MMLFEAFGLPVVKLSTRGAERDIVNLNTARDSVWWRYSCPVSGASIQSESGKHLSVCRSVAQMSLPVLFLDCLVLNVVERGRCFGDVSAVI